MNTNDAFRPERALVHPLWVGALWILILNDQVLKGSKVLPGWLTGKLSDFAGFLIFPMLLAVLLRARRRSELLLCHAAAAVLLLFLELSPGFCGLLASTLGWRLWPDPTDLLALTSIAVSWLVLAPRASRPLPERRLTSRGLLLTGCLACAATSASQPPRELTSAVLLHNRSGRDLEVRIGTPRDGMVFDCTIALRTPETLFRPEHFTAQEHLRLVSGDLLPVDHALDDRAGGWGSSAMQRSCQVRLLSVEGNADRLVVWDPSVLQARSYSQVRSIEQTNLPPEATIVLADTTGQVQGPAALVRPGPSSLPPVPTGVCAVASPAQDPAWSQSATDGRWLVKAIAPGSDGCDVVTLNASGFGDRRVSLCSEPLRVPFVVGDTLNISHPGGADRLQLDRVSDQTSMLLVHRTQTAITPGSCQPATQRCGSAIGGYAQVDTLAGTTLPLARGERATFTGRGWKVDLAMQRAERRVLAEPNCTDGSSLDGTASYVLITRKE